MGESVPFTDFGGMGLPGGDTPDVDVGTGGGSGDPYGGGDFGGFGEGALEAASQGALPGGADGQLTPFSPNGGVDATDIFKLGSFGRAAGSMLQIGPRGSILSYDSAGGGLPNLGTSPAVRARGETSASVAGAIVRQVRATTGLRVTAHSIVALIVRYGFEAAARLTGLAAQQLLTLFMAQKGVRHHRRGPGLYTIARKFRQHARLQATVSRILGRGGHAQRRHRRAPFHTMRRRSRRR
jgi:hypothetical protein